MFLHSKIYVAFLTIFIVTSTGCISIAFAQSIDNIFTIHNVQVDETASSASKAKKTALENAQEKAFIKLVERLATSSSKDFIYDKDNVSRLVTSFEINTEELSSTRYIATLTFYFNELKTKDYIESLTNEKLAINQPDSVLILPIMRYSDISIGSVFWEENNSWYEAWKNYDLSNSFIPLRLPLGDLSDMQIAPEKSIVKHNLSSIKQLMQRHETTKAIIAIFEMEDMAMEHGLLHLYKVGNNAVTHVKTMKLQENISNHKLIFTSAIEQVITYVETTWQSEEEHDNMNLSSVETNILADAVFQNIGQWIKIQKHLSDAFTVQNTEVLSLGRNVAQIKIKHRGNIEQLRVSLQEEGLELFLPVANMNRSTHNQNIYEIHLASQQQ